MLKSASLQWFEAWLFKTCALHACAIFVVPRMHRQCFIAAKLNLGQLILQDMWNMLEHLGLYSGHDLGILWIKTHLLLMAGLAPPGQNLTVQYCSFIAADLQLWARKIEGQHLVNVISFAQPNRSWIHFVNPYSIFSWCAKDRYRIVKWFRVAHAADFPCFSSRTVGQFWSASFSDLLRGVVNSFWYGSCASVLISYLWGSLG